MLPSPLPESNYYIVFTKANSPSDTYASKTKLPPISGTLSLLHRSILLQDLILPHRNYLHQSHLMRFTFKSIWFRNEPLGKTTTPFHFASGNGGNKIYVIPSRRAFLLLS